MFISCCSHDIHMCSISFSIYVLILCMSLHKCIQAHGYVDICIAYLFLSYFCALANVI